MTLVLHTRTSGVAVDDLLRTGIAAPDIRGANAVNVMCSAGDHQLSYLSQLFVYSVMKANAIDHLAQLRVWDGFAAVLAVICIYRTGRRCISPSAGVLAAFMLAATPPDVWSRHALTVCVVLFSFEQFLVAVRRDTPPRWVIWMAATLLLFCTGVFAEVILLQTWFLALLAVWCCWHLCCRWMPEPEDADYADARRDALSSMQRSATRYGDRSGYRAATLVAVCAAVMTLVTFATGSRFLSFSVKSLVFMAVLSIALSAGLVLLLLLCIPAFEAEREAVRDWIMSGDWQGSSSRPEDVFLPVLPRSCSRFLLAYSGAVILFLPVLYKLYPHITVFVDTWEFGRFLSYASGQPPHQIVLALVPWAWLILTSVAFHLGLLTRDRLIGCCSVVILSSLYLFQQRYAVYAAPFHVLAIAGMVTTTATVAREGLQVWRERSAHADLS
ncbi:hypothetical protein GX586_15220 [bacterium]|nr:hypothetical protein [bacterium]